MAITKKINANGTEISILLQGNENDYICLTDMARYKDKQRTDYIIQNWLRSRSTIEYLGVWEQLHNPNFNPIEFDGFRNQAGLHSFSLRSDLLFQNGTSNQMNGKSEPSLKIGRELSRQLNIDPAVVLGV